MRNPPSYSPEFKASVIRELLMTAASSEEFITRYGVPRRQIRRWARQVALRISESFADGASSVTGREARYKARRSSDKEQHSILSVGEVEMLLGSEREQ